MPRDLERRPGQTSIPLGDFADGDNYTDNGAAFPRWVAAIKKYGLPGWIDPGTYLTGAGIVVDTDVGLRFAGPGPDWATIKGMSLPSGDPLFKLNSKQNSRVEGVRFTSDGVGGGNGLHIQYDGASTSVRNSIADVAISNFANGWGLVANNIEMFTAERVYVFGGRDGIYTDNTGNASALAVTGNCLSNKFSQCRVLSSPGRGWYVRNQTASVFEACQSLQTGKTPSGGTEIVTPGYEGIYSVHFDGTNKSCYIRGFDIESYRISGGNQVFDHLVSGLLVSGFRHEITGLNSYGMATPIRLSSATDCLVGRCAIVQAGANGLIDSGCVGVGVEHPGQWTDQGLNSYLIGGGRSGYTRSPAMLSVSDAAGAWRDL